MINASIGLQDLRRRIYIKAKAEPHWRYWGIYVHVCKLETLREAYRLAKENKGAPGLDSMTFQDIEGNGREEFLQQIHDELISRTYFPTRNRKKPRPYLRREGGSNPSDLADN